MIPCINYKVDFRENSDKSTKIKFIRLLKIFLKDK